jgi:pimeloyl-ACP methyl ester carboxylesterase
MTTSTNPNPASTRTGWLPIDDTALAVTDTHGPGRAVVYLNGAYASQRHWRPVIAELGAGWRHVSYDERARGRSKRSADYSFEACLRDLEAVLDRAGWIARCWSAGPTERPWRPTGRSGTPTGWPGWWPWTGRFRTA